jgi:hypothetical protein
MCPNNSNPEQNAKEDTTIRSSVLASAFDPFVLLRIRMVFFSIPISPSSTKPHQRPPELTPNHRANMQPIPPPVGNANQCLEESEKEREQ